MKMIEISQKQRLNLLRISIGIIYLWFGALKFFPNLSPAESIATETVDCLTLHILPKNWGCFILAFCEILIGFLLIFNFYIKQTIVFAIIHMIFTFTPLFVFSDLSFTKPPYAFTLLGQYILKNIIIMAALLVIYPDPKEKELLV